MHLHFSFLPNDNRRSYGNYAAAATPSVIATSDGPTASRPCTPASSVSSIGTFETQENQAAQLSFRACGPKRSVADDSSKKANVRGKRVCRVEVLRESRNAILTALLSGILDVYSLSKDDMSTLRDGQGFTTHPLLALTYFHSCAQHAFVHNNEHLLPNASLDDADEDRPSPDTQQNSNGTAEDDGTAENRLLRVLDEPTGNSETTRCQQTI